MEMTNKIPVHDRKVKYLLRKIERHFTNHIILVESESVALLSRGKLRHKRTDLSRELFPDTGQIHIYLFI